MRATHDFCRIDSGVLPEICTLFEWTREAVAPGDRSCVDDDVVELLLPTLGWIDSELPYARFGRHRGLARYGVTLLRSENSLPLADLAERWTVLLQLAPSRFSVPGGLEPIERDSVVAQLDALSALARRVGDGQALLHLGL